MGQPRFTIDGYGWSERRLQDRRQNQEEEIVDRPRTWSRAAIITLALIATGVSVWQRQWVVQAPIWLARASRADRSDLYLGKTNGIANRTLVDQARNYLTDIDHTDASGNVTSPEALRSMGGQLDIAWFKRHVPDGVDFDPFAPSGGRFVVSWYYYPGCQKAVWKSPRADTDWYNLRGRPCFPLCRVSVLMAPDLRLTAIKLDTIQP